MDSAGADVGAFTNEPVTADDLPRLDEVAFDPLAPAYLRLRAITAAGVAAVSILIAVGVIALAPSPLTVLVVGLGLLVIGAGCVLHRVEADRMGYVVREHDLSFRSGVVSRSTSTVPFARVQHVSIGRGPLDRRFGVASLQVRTAGGSIGIPGLPAETAERLKLLVTERAAELADAEIDDPAPTAVAAAPTGIDGVPPLALPPPIARPVDHDER